MEWLDFSRYAECDVRKTQRSNTSPPGVEALHWVAVPAIRVEASQAALPPRGFRRRQLTHPQKPIESAAHLNARSPPDSNLMLLKQLPHRGAWLLLNAQRQQGACVPESRRHRSPRLSIATSTAISRGTLPAGARKNSFQSISSSGIFSAPEATSCASCSHRDPCRKGKSEPQERMIPDHDLPSVLHVLEIAAQLVLQLLDVHCSHISRILLLG